MSPTKKAGGDDTNKSDGKKCVIPFEEGGHCEDGPGGSPQHDEEYCNAFDEGIGMPP